MATKIDFIFFDAGGGHRSAATALDQVIREQSRPWEVRLVNLQELLDEIDVFRKFTGIRMQDVYNLLLRKGWTLGSPQMVPVMHAIIRSRHAATVRLLDAFWRRSRPDLVVSFVPNFNRALAESLRGALPATPLATVLTDLADYPPHFWMEPVPQYVICGTARAARQALDMGHPAECVLRVSGMILHPRFYRPPDVDRAAERRRLGLDPSRPTGLVLFGGHGSEAIAKIAQRLEGAATPLQLILICGHNLRLAARLRRRRWRIPVHVEEFTREIPYFMKLSDFFVGKPGPGSLSEALSMDLPVIVESNAWTLPQERYNAQWILERQAGLVLPSFRGIRRAAEELLENYPRFRAAAAALENRAVFEIPELLADILSAGRPGPRPLMPSEPEIPQ